MLWFWIFSLFLAKVSSSSSTCPLDLPAGQFNAAKHKYTEQSSDYNIYNSSLAVDGKCTTLLSELSCTHTNGGLRTWWRVDLGHVFTVSAVTLTNRADKQGYRLKNFKILASNSSINPISSSDQMLCAEHQNQVEDGETKTFYCSQKIQTRYISIIKNEEIKQNSQFLVLCEVQVTADCLEGDYGKNCAEKCSTWCRNNDTCNKMDGKCPNGCASGWRNDKCDTKCADGSYGMNCTEDCGKCLNEATCDKSDGTCQDCQPGYQLPLCTIFKLTDDSPGNVNTFLIAVIIVGLVLGIIIIISTIIIVKAVRKSSGKELDNNHQSECANEMNSLETASNQARDYQQIQRFSQADTGQYEEIDDSLVNARSGPVSTQDTIIYQNIVEENVH